MSSRAALLALAIAFVLPALASAASPPTVKVVAKPGSVTVTGADALVPGATHFDFSGTGREVDLSLVRLKPGRTAAELFAAAARTRDTTKLQQYGEFMLGASPQRGLGYSVDVDLTAATYVLADVTRKPKQVGTFTVSGTPSGVALPRADATVTLKDYRISASGKLPKNGAIAIHSNGPSPHFLVAFPLKRASDARDALRLLKQGNERKFEPLIGGQPASLVGLISPGTTNVVQMKLRPGTWVLACFYADAKSMNMPHIMRGMETKVTVK
jgi:hypothetical protein